MSPLLIWEAENLFFEVNFNQEKKKILANWVNPSVVL